MEPNPDPAAPPAATVTEIIAQYEALLEQGDHSAARAAIQSLEQDRFQNWKDWEKICAFLKWRNLNARLEIITRRLLKTTPPNTPKPYFLIIDLQTRSGRLAEAYELLEACRKRFGGAAEYRFEIVSALFETAHYQECLKELQTLRKQEPEGVGYAFLEVKCQMKLGDLRSAKANLKRMRGLLKNDPKDWNWYLFLARDLEDTASLINAEQAIIQRIEAGDMPVTHSLLFAFMSCALKPAAARIIKHADPATGWGIPHACYVFNLATSFGNFATSLKFGSHILEHDPGNELRPQIEKLLAGNSFLMA